MAGDHWLLLAKVGEVAESVLSSSSGCSGAFSLALLLVQEVTTVPASIEYDKVVEGVVVVIISVEMVVLIVADVKVGLHCDGFGICSSEHGVRVASVGPELSRSIGGS